ncbi:MAG: biotin--[Clostridia bacterium]|nr:biotin--[acetyl-CoA-carboxylase] ligase [Clostridia bacterium]
MRVRDIVLTFLENNQGEYISGEKIASNVGVSRNAVWKAIKQLQTQGHKIHSSTNKGYCLDRSSDVLSKQSIEKHLNTNVFDIEVVKSVSSTNTILRQRAEQGEKEGTVLIAEEQTHGRGRLGRDFFSPINTGIYMSIILRPSIPAEKSVMITTCAAVAVAEAIEEIAKKEAKIKWVNDIFCGDKKVCGILTEAALAVESGTLAYAVLGIGINVFPPENSFPSEIENIADSVFDNCDTTENFRSILIARVLENFWKYYGDIENRPHFEQYKRRSMVLSNKINVISGKNTYEAFALDLDENFNLIIMLPDGEIKHLNSGEVSVRRK